MLLRSLKIGNISSELTASSLDLLIADISQERDRQHYFFTGLSSWSLAPLSSVGGDHPGITSDRVSSGQRWLPARSR